MNFQSRAALVSMPVMKAHAPSCPTWGWCWRWWLCWLHIHFSVHLVRMRMVRAAVEVTMGVIMMVTVMMTIYMKTFLTKSWCWIFIFDNAIFVCHNLATLISMCPSALISPVIQKPWYFSGLAIWGVWNSLFSQICKKNIDLLMIFRARYRLNSIFFKIVIWKLIKNINIMIIALRASFQYQIMTKHETTGSERFSNKILPQPR